MCMEYAAPRAGWTVHDGAFTAPGAMRIVHKTRMQLPPSPPEPSVLQDVTACSRPVPAPPLCVRAVCIPCYARVCILPVEGSGVLNWSVQPWLWRAMQETCQPEVCQCAAEPCLDQGTRGSFCRIRFFSKFCRAGARRVWALECMCPVLLTVVCMRTVLLLREGACLGCPAIRCWLVVKVCMDACAYGI